MTEYQRLEVHVGLSQGMTTSFSDAAIAALVGQAPWIVLNADYSLPLGKATVTSATRADDGLLLTVDVPVTAVQHFTDPDGDDCHEASIGFRVVEWEDGDAQQVVGKVGLLTLWPAAMAYVEARAPEQIDRDEPDLVVAGAISKHYAEHLDPDACADCGAVLTTARAAVDALAKAKYLTTRAE